MSAAGALTVIKVGGGLSALPGALDMVGATLARLGHRYRLLLVPGGGPFADAVRAYEARDRLPPDAAQWMAILAMDQYAHVLVQCVSGAVLVEEPAALATASGQAGVAVLAPYRWLRATDPLPHSWDVTSDSVAAFVAGALGAARLVLVKPTSGGAELVDPYFGSALPAGMSWWVLGWEEIGKLEGVLQGAASTPSAGGGPAGRRAALP
jgi:5-(aminomethyl)-3-furanmethanol phosphate kinase